MIEIFIMSIFMLSFTSAFGPVFQQISKGSSSDLIVWIIDNDILPI